MKDKTPPLLSIGERCMEQGWSFIWEPHRTPFLIDPVGNVLYCVVINNVPYIYEGVYARYGSFKKGPSKVPKAEIRRSVKSAKPSFNSIKI